ncbi:MAG: hypothetical protein EOO88_41705 [Pedobacter sp.]|nr:MAG: hypothetical protein EOO88_41705 [Pedobacter sp.]
MKAYYASEDEVAQKDGQVPISIPSSESTTCNGPDRKTCLSYVEFDDFGRLFNRAQLNQALASAEKFASIKDPEGNGLGGVIVVYVHGWKHNAKNGDDDLDHFKDALQNVGELDEKVLGYNRRFMGIYVGWRGDSVTIPLVKNLTFWDRKITAHAVGNGAVFELFKQLTVIRNKYPTSRLVIVGHSFGTAVVYSAMEHQILSEIIESPPGSSQEIDMEKLTKRWDAIILVNSAFEAMQVRGQYAAARSREYAKGQLPYLIFVTSNADWATNYAFPAGRAFSTIFKKYSDTDGVIGKEMNTTAIGHYIPFVTHQLVAVDKCPLSPIGINTRPKASMFTKANAVFVPNINRKDNLANVFDSDAYCFGESEGLRPSSDSKAEFIPYLTRCDTEEHCFEVAPGHKITRGPLNVPGTTLNPMPARFPIMNIRTTKEIMTSHTDMWNPLMQRFMVQLILHTVTKPREPEKALSQTAVTTSFPITALKPEASTRAEVKAGRKDQVGTNKGFPDAPSQPGR